MKKWLVILTLSLLLTGCEKKQETDEKEESPKASVEMSVETSESEEETEETEETKESEEEIEETEETKESEESIAQTEESSESVEENKESVPESTEPVVESTEAIESESSEEVVNLEESTEATESTEDVEEEEYPVWQPEDLFPNSSEEEIPDALLEGLSADSLSYARYNIFWRNGLQYSQEKELNPVEMRNIEKIKAVEGKVRLASPVPTTDLVYLYCDIYGGFFYVYISDGDMYYCCEYGGMFSTSYYVGQMQKYTGLTNIKRLKTFNRGSGVDPTPCLITEEGEVYWVLTGWSEEDEDIILEKFEFLEDYQVEDILLYSGEWQHQVEVLLKDGSIIYLESEPWG